MPAHQNQTAIPKIAGKARIVRNLYQNVDIRPFWTALSGRVEADPTDAAAFFDMSLLLQGMSKPKEAETLLRAALEFSKVYEIQRDDLPPQAPTVLVLVAAGDFMANTPVEFLLENARIRLIIRYVDEQLETLADLPDHDLLFVGIGHSQPNIRILNQLEPLLAHWPKPVLNGNLAGICDLSREGVATKLETEASIFAPRAWLVGRDRLVAVAAGDSDVDTLFAGAAYPLIVRPLDTHAGIGMEKIEAQGDLQTYLPRMEGERFYAMPFIDYSSDDGKFRKQRIAFIDGKAFASHMAISEHWMVHYLNASMTEYPARRDEEARWMQSFDQVFAVRHAEAFKALYERIGLDYFALDCSEMPDGRLLVFESDNAMIVHSLDPVEIFPYKTKPMQRLFDAFEAALLARIPAAG